MGAVVAWAACGLLGAQVTGAPDNTRDVTVWVVSHDGNPIVDVPVIVARNGKQVRRENTDDMGCVVFAGLPCERLTFWTSRNKEFSVSLRAGRAARVTLELPHFPVVIGTVFVGGEPAAGVTVRASAASGNRETVTGEDGHFRIQVKQPGAIAVRAVRGYKFDTLEQTIDVGWGDTCRVDLDFPARSHAAGVLLGLDDKPAVGVPFELHHNSRVGRLTCVTDASGAFAFTGLPDGRFRLGIESKSSWWVVEPPTFRVRGDVPHLEVRVAEGCTVTGSITLLAPDSISLETITVVARRDGRKIAPLGRVEADGSFCLRVPPGPCSLIAHHEHPAVRPKGIAQRAVDVPPEGLHAVDFVIEITEDDLAARPSPESTTTQASDNH